MAEDKESKKRKKAEAAAAAGVDKKAKKKRKLDEPAADKKVKEEKKKKKKAEKEKEEQTTSPQKGVKAAKKIVTPTPAKLDPSALSIIASPLADIELIKRLYVLIGKAARGKALRRGIKEVAKALRKNQKGICVLAGNVFPIDVIAHLPVACEEASVPYCFVNDKESLGRAAHTKRPTSVLLITENATKSDAAGDYTACVADVKTLQRVAY